MNIRSAVSYLCERHFRCAPATVRALVRANKLRCYRGPTDKGPMQFSPDELDRFLRDGMIGGDSVPTVKPVVAPSKSPIDDWEKRYQRIKGA